VNREITAWLEESLDIPRLFIEPDFDRRPTVWLSSRTYGTGLCVYTLFPLSPTVPLSRSIYALRKCAPIVWQRSFTQRWRARRISSENLFDRWM
jgi:hypothetical protein